MTKERKRELHEKERLGEAEMAEQKIRKYIIQVNYKGNINIRVEEEIKKK